MVLAIGLGVDRLVEEVSSRTYHDLPAADRSHAPDPGEARQKVHAEGNDDRHEVGQKVVNEEDLVQDVEDDQVHSDAEGS